MLPNGLLNTAPEWGIALLLLALLLGSGEAGYRLGRRRRSHADETLRTQVTALHGSAFGLLSLLLGFTLSMAVARFDSRRQLTVEEANAIGTAFLRSETLPAPYPARLASLFRLYAGVRLDASQSNRSEQAAAGLDQEAERLQRRLWAEAVAAAARDNRAVPTGLFLQSVNEVIDSKEKRDAALDNRVPDSVLILLFLGAVLVTGMGGYGYGLVGRRPTVGRAALAVLITLVIFVIVDLDRPQSGLIRVSDRSMINVKESMEGSK